jgi:hypothetical protein
MQLTGHPRHGAADCATAPLATPRSPPAWVEAAATGLLQLLRQSSVAGAATMLRGVCEAPDPVAAIGALMQVGRGAGACACGPCLVQERLPRSEGMAVPLGASEARLG